MKQLDNNSKVALALSSGGAKGYAHIGVIRAIEECGAKITSIAGTSMGALVGGLYAAGKLQEAYEWLSSIDARDVFRLADIENFNISGFIDGEKLLEKIHQIIGDVRIEELDIPFSAIATILETGEEVVFTRGKLLDAIRASISMPVLFRPFSTPDGKYHLIDGGIVNGLPINRLHRTEGDTVIAVNLDTYGYGVYASALSSKLDTLPEVIRNMLPDFMKNNGPGNLISIFLKSYDIALKQNKWAMVKAMQPEIYLNIDLKGYSTYNFADAETISELGYEQMSSLLGRASTTIITDAATKS